MNITKSTLNTSVSSASYAILFGSYSPKRSARSRRRLLRSQLEAIDTETTGLDVHSSKVQVTNISYWNSSGRGKAFHVSNHEGKNAVALIASDPNITKLMFNAKFDVRMLAKEGINIRSPLICVLIAAQMMLPDELTKNLKQLSRKLLKDPYLEEIRLKKYIRERKINVRERGYADIPGFIIDPYNLKDSKNTLELFYYLMPALDKHHQWTVLEREMLLMRKVVLPMESYGVMLDLEEVDRLKILVRKEIQGIKKQLVTITGLPEFNPNSQTQVLAALRQEGIFRPTRFSNKTGAPKADIIALLEYPSPLGSLVVKYRKIAKAQTTYLKNFDRKILRVSFNQLGARTGRFSSSGPNLQNIPRAKEDSLLSQMRRCFIARPGCRLLFIDYKQLQLRLAAHFSGEEHMLQAINEGKDLHDQTCMLVFERDPKDKDWELMRYLAKTFNFAVLFGAGPERLRETILKDTMGALRLTTHAIARYLNDWKEKHSKIMRLFDTVAMEIATTGGVTTPYGRFLSVDSSASYVGVNYLIQGTEADFIKLKMLVVTEMLKGYKSRMQMTVHDELGFNLHRDETHLVRPVVNAMQDLTTFKVPLVCSVSIGKNWYDKRKVSL